MIKVTHYGNNKPGPGVNPKWSRTNPKLPFGKTQPVNWWTGKHLQLAPHGDTDGVGKHSLTDRKAHTDVAALDLADGDILIYDGTDFVNAPFTHKLAGDHHDDVSIFDLAEGDILIYDGEDFVNQPFAHNLGSAYHPDVDTAGAADGDLLKWDATAGKWVKVTPVSLTVTTDVQWSLTSKSLQKKTRSIVALSVEGESEWTTVEGGAGVSHADL